MCGRFVLISDLKTIQKDFDIQDILPKDQEQVWLNSDVVDASDLLSILKAYPAEEMNYKSGMGPHSF